MGEQTDEKRRYDREAQAKKRGTKRSYVTEIENLKILLAWEAGLLSEGCAAKLLKTDRVSAREMKLNAVEDFK